MEFELIKEALPIEKKRKGVYRPVIEDWFGSENKTLVFKCKNTTEASSALSAAYTYRKLSSNDFTVFKKNPLTIILVKP